MKGIIVLASLPVVILLGLVVAVLDLSQSRAQSNAYGAQFATPLAHVVMQGVAVAALAIVFIVGIVVFERRRVMRPRLRRRRRPPPRLMLAEAALIAPPEAEPAVAAEPLLEDIVVTDVVVHVPAAAPPAVVGVGHGASDPLRHWGLREPAFDNAPTPRFLYLSPAHTEALFRLRYAIRHRKGGAMLTGNSGCGKTTLARTLVRELDTTRFDVALISNPRLTAPGLLQEILYQLRVPVSGKDKPSLIRALEARLVENLRRGRDTVVIVDEAQLIEDDAVFNELRLLLNFQTNDRFLISLVLSGSDELVETLRRQPHLAQRCGVRASLEPLDREQTGHYVRHRLVTAGREAETLTEDAVDELFTATGGTPRVINAVCDLTLFVGAAAGVRCVDGDLVRRVAGDVTAAA